MPAQTKIASFAESLNATAADQEGSESPESRVTVKVSSEPRREKKPTYLYPYQPLESRTTAYRGYPIDGPKSLKRKWKIQLVSSACTTPPEPLPQFPQQEILRRVENRYTGCQPWDLNEEQVKNNSGEAYLVDGEDCPRSEYFFTAGYHRDSAVRLQKPFTHSIYRCFVSGHSVPVKIVKG